MDEMEERGMRYRGRDQHPNAALLDSAERADSMPIHQPRVHPPQEVHHQRDHHENFVWRVLGATDRAAQKGARPRPAGLVEPRVAKGDPHA
eukprot:scaffold55431_cov41-Tisochrysis_lutea.AAC.2